MRLDRPVTHTVHPAAPKPSAIPRPRPRLAPVTSATLESTAYTVWNGADPRHPHAAPIHGDLRGLPPLLIQVGAAETLLDDSVVLARKVGAADVPVELQIWPEMIHIWHIFFPMLGFGGSAQLEQPPQRLLVRRREQRVRADLVEIAAK